MVNQDFKDLFATFNAKKVDYLVVGAHALAVHGHVRATKDLDVWVRPTLGNGEKICEALSEFGAPVSQLKPGDFATDRLIFQVGVAPVRIDIITAVDGVDFEECWTRRVSSHYGDQPVSVLSREDLIRNKRASGRLQDLADIEKLEGKSKNSPRPRRP